MLWLDIQRILVDDLLVKMDMATMAHSLEARLPFLDQELFEFASRLPWNIKLSGGRTKPLLRSLASKYLPQEVVNVPKRGFEAPLAHWLKNDLREMVYDLLCAPNAEIRNYLAQDEIIFILCCQ